MADKIKEARIARLALAAQERRSAALERTERAVQRLLADNEPLSFANVAREAGVSVSYLYKYPDVKRNLQYIRKDQSERGSAKAKAPSLSEKSAARVIAKLRLRIKELTAKCSKQKEQIAALSGQLYEATSRQLQGEDLRKENARLKQHLNELRKEHRNAAPPPSLIAPRVCSELQRLGIRLTSSLRCKIRKHPEPRVLNAVAVVNEAAAAGNVRSKARLFIKALEEGWEPTDLSLLRDEELRDFAAWFRAARARQLVRASRGTDAGITVLTTDGSWEPYKSLRQKKGWSLQELMRQS